MKRIILLFGLLAMVTVYAQAPKDSVHVYKSIFGEDSTKWNEMYTNSVTSMDDWIVSTLVFSANHATDSVGDDGSTYCSIDFDSTPLWYKSEYASLRLIESGNHDKVYLQFQSTREGFKKQEVLVMDLNLQEGDTFLIRKIFMKGHNNYDSILESIPVVVDSVFYEDNVKHIRFDYTKIYDALGNHYYHKYVTQFEMIEGVGPIWGCFYQTMGQAGFPDYMGVANTLLCCYHDGEKIYEQRYIPYDHYVFENSDNHCFVFYRGYGGAVSETGKEYFSLFPNPHDGGTSLYNPEGRFIKLEVYDMSGRRMLTAESSETSIPIEMTSWPAGVYLIRIEENGHVSYLKSVKQ